MRPAARLAGDLELDVDGARRGGRRARRAARLDADERRARHHPDPHPEHGQRDQRQQRAEGLRPARLQPRRVRRRRAALRRRHRARAVDPAGHRPAAPRHHLGDGPAGLRPQVRGAAHRHGGGAGRRRGRARRHLRRAGGQRPGARSTPTTSPRRTACSSAGPTAATSVRPTSCSCPCRPGRWTTRRWPRSPSASRRPTSASTSTGSPRRPVQIVHVRSYAIGLMPSLEPERHRVGRRPSRRRMRSPAAARSCSPAATARRRHDTPFYDAARCAPATSSPARRSSSSSTRRPSSRPGTHRPRAARRQRSSSISRRRP